MSGFIYIVSKFHLPLMGDFKVKRLDLGDDYAMEVTDNHDLNGRWFLLIKKCCVSDKVFNLLKKIEAGDILIDQIDCEKTVENLQRAGLLADGVLDCSKLNRTEERHFLPWYLEGLKRHVDELTVKQKQIAQVIAYRFSVNLLYHAGGRIDVNMFFFYVEEEVMMLLPGFASIRGIYFGKGHKIEDLHEDGWADVVSSIKRLNSDVLQNLFHFNLMREAYGIVHSNDYAPFVIAFTALETNIKCFIKDKSPDAAWLIENMPSPQIEKIVRHYLPTILELKYEPCLGKIADEVKKRAEQRNKIVHGKYNQIKFDTMSNFLAFVNDMNWFLEFLKDEVKNSWCKDNISKDFISNYLGADLLL